LKKPNHQYRLMKFVQNHKLQLFHKKKLELGRIQFVTDDLYFHGIKIRSSFRPVLINQPGADSERSRFKSQIDKFTIKWDYYAIATLFLLMFYFYSSYVKPILTKVSGLIYGETWPLNSITSLFNFLGPMLGLDDDSGLLVTVFTECTIHFSLIPF